jgi:pyruvate kinase
MTLGPSSEEKAILTRLLKTADSFRLNASHLNADSLGRWLTRLQEVFQEERHEIPVVLDLQGAKMRCGDYPATESPPEKLRLTLSAEASQDPSVLPVPEPLLFEHCQVGEILTLNDNKVEVRVEAKEPGTLHTRVLRPGPLSSFKGVNRPGHPFPVGPLRTWDRSAIEITKAFSFVHFAYSFVLDGSVAQVLRKVTSRRLVAKIERPESFPHLTSIDAAFDEIWLCRGDLGAQAGLTALGPLQQEFTATLPKLSSPCILAGQVLEHMTHFPQPTRSEVVHLHDVRQAGWQGIVLSDETAIGKNPVAVVDFLDQI